MPHAMKIALGLTAALLVTSGAEAKKAQLIPIIPFPNATTTSVFGIADDNNTIAGSYIDGTDGLTHGFYGTLDGNYTSFDFGTSGFTQARGISPDGKTIPGFANNDGNHCDFLEFEGTLKKGKFKAVTKDGNQLAGEAQGINSGGTFAGDYCQSDGVTVIGLTGKKNKWQSDVTAPVSGSPYTGERGINDAGTLVGFYVDPDTSLQVGTIITGGVTQVVNYPDPSMTYTVFEGINNAGLATGQWDDTSGIVHSFSYDTAKSKFVEIDDPNAASFTQAWGVNKSGLIAVSSDAGSYIYCVKKCPTIGTKAITIEAREIHVSPAQFLRYGESKGHATVKHALPKGAAVQ